MMKKMLIVMIEIRYFCIGLNKWSFLKVIIRKIVIVSGVIYKYGVI